MSATAAIAQRLLTQGAFHTVSGAAQLAAVAGRRQFSGGTGYVMLASVKPGENELVNAVSQRVTESYAVLFWIVVANNALGDAAADAVDGTRAAVLAALLGWSPDADRSPLVYAGGQLNEFETGAVLWEERFSTDTYVRSA